MNENNYIKIIAVGDIMLGDQAITVGHGVKSIIKKNGEDFLFKKVKKYFKNKDILIGNLESVLSDKNINNKSLKSLKLRGEPNSINILKNTGFDIVSLANNHALEHGKEALYDTIESLKKKKIKYIGVNQYSRKPLILNIKSRNIAFFNYCLVKDSTSYKSIKIESEIIKDIEYYNKKVDVKIISLHWGTEFIEYPSKNQIELAHNIIDHGGDVILGHHPHVLQGIEFYKKKLIAYSLGNFVFDMTEGKSQNSIILNIYINDNEIKIDQIPIKIDNSYRPIPNKNSNIEIYDEEKINKLINKSIEEYNIESIKIKKSIGKQRRMYFLKNVYRYPPNYSIQYLISRIKDRIKKIKRISNP